MSSTQAKLFSIKGYPCSGQDWLARLLSLHPEVLVLPPADRLGPIGGATLPNLAEAKAAGVAAVAAAMAGAKRKPGVTHVGVVGLHRAMRGLPGPEVVLLRDGRDVVVQWTLAQLRDRGAALQRFLTKEIDARAAGDSRMPELAARFAADPDDVLVRNPGLLLWDYDWLRYAAHLWDDCVTGHSGGLGALADGKCSGEWPIEVFYEQAKADPRATFDRVIGELGLDPAVVPAFAEPDPIAASEPDRELLASWEVGLWRRWFTPRASKLFKMDGWQGLEYVTRQYGDDEWQGDCPPFPA